MEIQERYVVREVEVQGTTSYAIFDTYYEQLGYKKIDCLVCATKSMLNAELISISLNACQEAARNVFEKPEMLELVSMAMEHSELHDDLTRFLDFHKKYDCYKGFWIVKEEDGSYKVQTHLNGDGWAVGAFASVESAESYIDEATQ